MDIYDEIDRRETEASEYCTGELRTLSSSLAYVVDIGNKVRVVHGNEVIIMSARKQVQKYVWNMPYDQDLHNPGIFKRQQN